MFRLFALASLMTVIALPAAAETLTIEMRGLKPQGRVMIALYDSQAAYDGGPSFRANMVEITTDTARTTFDVPAGSYAIKAFHDENGNGNMDTNPFGVPVEPYAFSNNAKGSMGPAPWAAAVFTVDGDATHNIDF